MLERTSMVMTCKESESGRNRKAGHVCEMSLWILLLSNKIGNVHPGLQKDMLAEFVKGCRNAGLGVACYYSVFLDTAIIKKHPDWMLQPGQNQPKEGLLFSKSIFRFV